LVIAIRRLLGRAWMLYILAIGLTLVMLPFSEVLRLPWAVGIEETTPLQVVWAIVSLHQTYYLVDVLALYVLLMLAAPLVLFLLCEGRTVWVLMGTWLIWAGFQVFPQQTELPWTTAGNNLFYLSAWQALFFTAMVIGYHRERLGAFIPPHWHLRLLLATGFGFAGLIGLYSNQSAILQTIQSVVASTPGGHAWSVADLEYALFAKGAVGIGRVVASAIVFAFLFQLITVFWAPVRRGLGWLLIALGQNALYAYSTHVVLALAVGVFATRVSAGGGMWLNAAMQAGSGGLIWLAIRLRVLYPGPENRRVWMLSVVPLAMAAIVIFRLDPSPAVTVAAADTVQSTAESDAIRRARSFGTPIPRTTSANPGMQAPSVSAHEGRPGDNTAITAATPQVPVVPLPLVAASVGPSAAQYVGDIAGTFREIWFYSPSLDRDMSYCIYLPRGYRTEGRRYPVLYMLHGGGASKDEWAAYGLVDDVDQAIESKDIKPLIVVMPQGDLSYWVNWVDGGPRWGDYIARDVRRQIDATFRTLPDASHRAIGGLSMGGAGALQVAFNHPDIFQVVGAHSPSLHLDDGTFAGIYGTGQDFAQREPTDLAATAPGIEGLKIWIDTGEEDPWLERDEMLHAALLERGIAHNWSVLVGGHNGDYWTDNLPAYLRFYDSVLNGETNR